MKVNVVSRGFLLTFSAVQWSQGVCTIEFPNPKKEKMRPLVLHPRLEDRAITPQHCEAGVGMPEFAD